MSLHDGNGIRTTVFFKGCNLRCKWCHNPETFRKQKELSWIGKQCIKCGICVQECQSKALEIKGNEIARNPELCTFCRKCVNNCFAEAHQILGKEYTVTKLCDEVEKDRFVFERSGGGVTISGGEPMVQFPFLKLLLKELNSRKIHVCLQTNLSFEWEKYEEIIPYIDYFMCDLKHIYPEEHLYWTGRDNRTILANLENLDKSGKLYCVRTPVVPGVNNDPETMKQISGFVSTLKNPDYFELLPFHRLATYKYKNIGMDYEFERISEIPEEEFRSLQKQFQIK